MKKVIVILRNTQNQFACFGVIANSKDAAVEAVWGAVSVKLDFHSQSDSRRIRFNKVESLYIFGCSDDSVKKIRHTFKNPRLGGDASIVLNILRHEYSGCCRYGAKFFFSYRIFNPA